jgi:sugar lactone lactonase YvrE
MTAFCLANVAAAALSAIMTLAGLGTAGYSGDGGAAAAAAVNNPYGIAIGPDGALYVCEIGNHVVRRIDLKSRTITTVAGTGKPGYAGDGGAATGALLNEPYEVRFDRAGDMYFVEMQNHLVRRVDRRTRRISTVAGTGVAGYSGDGGAALRAQLRQPHSIAFSKDGSLLICDIGNNRIRRVDLVQGIISTWAGTGARGTTPDGAPLAGTPLNGPRALDSDPEGNFYLALREGNAVYRIDGSTLTFRRLAGTGEQGYAGDGGPALQAKLSGPKGIAWSSDGGVYIADTESHTIRRIDLKDGTIRTAVGNGKRGDGPDGDPTSCGLARPHGIFAAPDGAIYIGDSENHRVRLLETGRSNLRRTVR